MKVIAISDQHGHTPSIPPCDLLLVGGDQCLDVFGGLTARAFPDRQWTWFRDTWLRWRYRQPVEACVLTWGNHDYCGVAHQNHESSQDGKRTTIACDRLVEVGGLRIYLTPWSNQFMTWAFMQEPEQLAAVYDQIPAGLDILVSHQPPHGCGDSVRFYDLASRGEAEHHYGSVALRAAILRARPKVVVCGHIHAGHGRHDCDGIPVFNVSVVNEAYERVHGPTLVWDGDGAPAP